MNIMKIASPAPFNDRAILDDYVAEALKLSGSKQRFSGVVVGYDQVGTTIFISSGKRQFLAFADGRNSLQPGDAVTFRIDGMRAKDIRKQFPANS
jgi:hypothetical protein